MERLAEIITDFFNSIDPKQTFIAQKQFVAAHIPLTPFQDPDRCDTMECMV